MMPTTSPASRLQLSHEMSVVIPFILMSVLAGACILSVCQLLERQGRKISSIIPLTLFIGVMAVLYDGLF